MKQVAFFTVAVITALMYMAGCKDAPSNPAKADKPKPEMETINTIELDEAQKYIKNYGDSCRKLGNTNARRSFTIGYLDLLDVLGLPDSLAAACKFHQVRAYVGIRGKLQDAEFHLLLTPVDSTGKDYLLTNAAGNKVVYDLITPCPKTCDETSSLYLAFGNIQAKQ